MTTEEQGTVQDVFNAEEQKAELGKAFNFKDYQISVQPTKQIVTIDDTGDTFEVGVKPLSWARRNQILSKSVRWTGDGETLFDGDAYVRLCLREMIVEAPWGRTTETFLLSIDERLGQALESLVPKAFGETTTEGGLGDIDNLKDDY